MAGRGPQRLGLTTLSTTCRMRSGYEYVIVTQRLAFPLTVDIVVRDDALRIARTSLTRERCRAGLLLAGLDRGRSIWPFFQLLAKPSSLDSGNEPRSRESSCDAESGRFWRYLCLTHAMTVIPLGSLGHFTCQPRLQCVINAYGLWRL
jgi:hypothetical protein